MVDRCENCDRDGCREATSTTWAAFVACSCDPDMRDPCEHQQAFNVADAACCDHTVNWRERARAVEADLTALRERMRWRDVADDCPDACVDVQVYSGHVQDGWLAEDGYFRDHDGMRIHNVTHWRPIDAPEPLPAAPEVQNG